MCIQIALLGECFATKATLEGFFLGVKSQVGEEVLTTVIKLVALVELAKEELLVFKRV